MSFEFFTNMQKRGDGEVYADLHKTDGKIYYTVEEAQAAIDGPHRHVVALIAMTRDEWDAPLAPPTKTLAKAFVALLAEQLDPEQWREMCRRNRVETQVGICHSHDFCDANEVMIEAFRRLGVDKLFGIGEPMSETVTETWNDAWYFAKFYYLS